MEFQELENSACLYWPKELAERAASIRGQFGDRKFLYVKRII